MICRVVSLARTTYFVIHFFSAKKSCLSVTFSQGWPATSSWLRKSVGSTKKSKATNDQWRYISPFIDVTDLVLNNNKRTLFCILSYVGSQFSRFQRQKDALRELEKQNQGAKLEKRKMEADLNEEVTSSCAFVRPRGT